MGPEDELVLPPNLPDYDDEVPVLPPDKCAKNYVYRGGSPQKINYYRGDHTKFSISIKPNSWNFYLSSTLTLWNLDWNWWIFLFFHMVDIILIKGGLLLAEITL